MMEFKFHCCFYFLLTSICCTSVSYSGKYCEITVISNLLRIDVLGSRSRRNLNEKSKSSSLVARPSRKVMMRNISNSNFMLCCHASWDCYFKNIFGHFFNFHWLSTSDLS